MKLQLRDTSEKEANVPLLAAITGKPNSTGRVGLGKPELPVFASQARAWEGEKSAVSQAPAWETDT